MRTFVFNKFYKREPISTIAVYWPYLTAQTFRVLVKELLEALNLEGEALNNDDNKLSTLIQYLKEGTNLKLPLIDGSELVFKRTEDKITVYHETTHMKLTELNH